MQPGPESHPLSAVQRAVLGMLRAYRAVLSPMLGQRCRFHPSCSHYTGEAVVRFGVLRGGVLGAFRLARCQPLCEGGLDPVPETWPRQPWRRNVAPAPLQDPPP